MTIEINDGDFFVGIWTLSMPGARDVLWAAKRPKDEHDWLIQWRFRYYVDDKAHGSKDKKSWYGAKVPGDRPVDEVLEFVHTGIAALAITGFGPVLEGGEIMSDKAEDVMKHFESMTCMHSIKMDSPDEADAAGYPEVAQEWRNKNEDHTIQKVLEKLNKRKGGL